MKLKGKIVSVMLSHGAWLICGECKPLPPAARIGVKGKNWDCDLTLPPSMCKGLTVGDVIEINLKKKKT